MRQGLRVVILSSSARVGKNGQAEQTWGLSQDSKLIEQTLRETNASGLRIDSIDYIDPVSFYGSPSKPPQVVDIQIHLETPCRAAWRWAKCNIVVVNPEWWPRAAWDWAAAPVEAGGAHIFVFKSTHARSLFPEVDNKRARVISWRAGSIQTTTDKKREFLYLVGASANKLAAAKIVCKAWRSSWPSLCVVGNDGVLAELRSTCPDSSCIVFQTSFSNDSDRMNAQATYSYHVVASAAEGYGFTFAEAAANGALPLWTDISVYKEVWGETVGNIGCIHTHSITGDSYREHARTFTEQDVANAVESLLTLAKDDDVSIRDTLRRVSTTHVREFRDGWRALLTTTANRIKSIEYPRMPSRIASRDLPHVAVITITRNRPRWFGNMARNILLSDYPFEKLTWIIADDGDVLNGGMCDAQVAKFQEKNPHISVIYIPISKQKTIGDKRNIACAAAPKNASLFVMMDDDDHYPASSIVRRVAWLDATKTDCVYCSTLPVYDCTRYISAVNVPPLNLAPRERISEATLCFTRNFWESYNFPSVSIAEGDGFLVGRESSTAEIPPEGIIVSFVHGRNVSSRRIPQESEPNGCHYGFDDTYFTYISELGL